MQKFFFCPYYALKSAYPIYICRSFQCVELICCHHCFHKKRRILKPAILGESDIIGIQKFSIINKPLISVVKLVIFVKCQPVLFKCILAFDTVPLCLDFSVIQLTEASAANI